MGSTQSTWGLHIVCEQRPVEMFSRATIIVPQCQQVRGMATLKAIQIRLKSVKNIQKITQSMKMVSAAKYARAERELKVCRPYGVGAQQFFEKAEVKDEEGEKGQLIIACAGPCTLPSVASARPPLPKTPTPRWSSLATRFATFCREITQDTLPWW